MSSEKSAPLVARRLHCDACGLAGVCLPAAIGAEELAAVEPLIEQQGARPRGEHVYVAGTPFTGLYIVRSGAVRSYITQVDGSERTVGFHLPAEFLGLDGPGHAARETSAVNLETTSVCRIPYARLQPLAARLPRLQVHLMRVMSREILDDRHLQLLLGRRPAAARIASFLLWLSRRNACRRLSALHFHLPMPRADIANYLGLVIETTSRVFTRLHRTGVIHLDRRDVRVLDMARLSDLAGEAGPEQAPAREPAAPQATMMTLPDARTFPDGARR